MTLPAEALRAALGEADLRVLLMALYQMTGEARWLAPPFQPARDINLIADEGAGLPPGVQADIRAAAFEVLSGNRGAAAIPVPAPDTMVALMSHCLGEPVGPEYTPMMLEEMGFRPRQPAWDGPPPTMPGAPVVIVGAGASGIVLAASLETLGIPYLVLEKNAEVGGTWLVNRYPGAAVDTPNHAYSFSFGTRHAWSRYFSRRDELLGYLIARSHEFTIRGNIRFGTRVTRCDWDEARTRWQVSVEGPDGRQVIEAFALVSAVGQLSVPNIPDLPGASRFSGRLFHSSEWPEDLDLAGRRVAVIGTGASAMQIVPEIAGDVAALDVYQRSPQWVRHIPRYREAMSTGQRWLLEHVPFYAEWFRFTMLWRYGDGLLRTLRKDPDWPHPERSLNRINDRHRVGMTAHIGRELAGRPDLLAKCVPDYPPYGKRILLDNDWYKTLRRPNVTLVAEAVRGLTPEAVETTAGARPADIAVLATGFRVGLLAAQLGITGRDGRRLAEDWADGNTRAHLGITVSGYPNLFILQGPNTGLAHGGSAIFQSECQARYLVRCLQLMIAGRIAAIEVRPGVQEAYVARVDAEHAGLVWTHPGMSTYYRNAQGRVTSVMPWRLVDYRAMTHEPDLAEYHLAPASVD